MSTVFYDKNHVKVTDSVFVTPTGDQYPIRNISSVSVREVENKPLLYGGAFLTFLGLFILYSTSAFAQMAAPSYSSGSGFSLSGIGSLLLGAALLYLWHKSKKYALIIGTGGVLQQAMAFPKTEADKFQILQEISLAINAAISNLQNT